MKRKPYERFGFDGFDFSDGPSICVQEKNNGTRKLTEDR